MHLPRGLSGQTWLRPQACAAGVRVSRVFASSRGRVCAAQALVAPANVSPVGLHAPWARAVTHRPVCCFPSGDGSHLGSQPLSTPLLVMAVQTSVANGGRARGRLLGCGLAVRGARVGGRCRPRALTRGLGSRPHRGVCDAFLQPGPFKTWPCVQRSRGPSCLCWPAHCTLRAPYGDLSSGRRSLGERAGRFLPAGPSVHLSQGTHGSPGRPVPSPLRD